jgi:alpha-L-glutamate ligase-like protein
VIKALRKAGVLGINRRNIEFTLGENDRRLYPLVDDKLKTKALCKRAGVATAEIIGTASAHFEIAAFLKLLRGRGDFVLKPARGAMGNGILVIVDGNDEGWVTASGRKVNEADIHYHASSIISGLYALGGQPDVAFAESRLEVHPSLRAVVRQGVPDIRIIVFRGVPVMAMTRLPTNASDGKANLHQGAVGAGIDLITGRTTFAVLGSASIEKHPDTAQPVVGLSIPDFDEALRIAVASTDLTGLGYIGADIVIDASRGPLLLELNARPGLAIQSANREGLLRRLTAIRESSLDGLNVEQRIELSRRIARRQQ